MFEVRDFSDSRIQVFHMGEGMRVSEHRDCDFSGLRVVLMASGRAWFVACSFRHATAAVEQGRALVGSWRRRPDRQAGEDLLAGIGRAIEVDQEDRFLDSRLYKVADPDHWHQLKHTLQHA